MAEQIKYGRFLHGGDYNPEQWLDRPDVLKQDIEYFKKAHINTVSVGIFSWAVLEPEEGKYNFDWLEEIINNLYKEGIYTILATPSGARPKWMADKYPEVLRMDDDRTRRFFGGRHNHCFTSPVYREKVHAIDKKLSERFGKHPAVLLWHISNEFSGECHCPLCQAKFREWLKDADFKLAETNDIYRTGIIGQFNLTFELAWKALQEIMKLHGINEATTGSPREILQMAYKIGFLNDSSVWLLMLKKRNTSVHIYNEEEIDELIMLIRGSFLPAFTDLQKILIEKLAEAENAWQ